MAGAKLDWTGVIPAATTQFDEGLAVDLDATQTVLDGLIKDGVDAIIVMGTVGENNSLEPEEKRAVLKAAVEVADGRVPIITGVSELTTARAERYAKDAEDIGVDALMVLPAMVYVPTQAELEAHFRAVAAASGLPNMLYNNPLMYRQTLNNDDLRRLSDVPNIVALKESAPDSRRITDIFNELGDRYAVMVGLDDVALEGMILGAKGWVSGLTNAFPEESVALVRAVKDGDIARALEIYRWFMPLLHLDSVSDLVQSIKLSETIMGRGTERVRMPRMPLAGARRAEVIAMVEKAAETRPIGSGKAVKIV
ncbi:dihydrodipicolinate synthase family protein [Brevundimonas diminuta]|jgi:4-hydroxy-tetrahydrodipicolinate synthase|uniref:Dihydrodipicolinate synthase n=1 Tax=Brevundimonas diminuta TaxID=293 RepID=A0A2X1AP50_BREDI|nr:dihydrodipicolinate synthase family protein [Brevundimonas diminuta]MBD3818834.1 dihydrodipicolinate synthase family protein [Brevundimonas diminuta]SPU46523.1 Dihydrodipicolinate synthase [Brevundimonas diminuta]